MKKTIVLSLVMVVFCTSGAWAFVGQVQGFDIGAVNSIHWIGGTGSAEGGNQVMFAQEQAAHKFGVSGLQKEMGVFVQTGQVDGPGPGTVRQTADIGGAQHQAGGLTAYPTSKQSQEMGVDLSTLVDKPYGPGAASGAQSFVGGQTQILITPTSMSAESQIVGAAQYAGIVGGPNADPTVKNTLNIDLGQNQTIVAPLPPHWH